VIIRKIWINCSNCTKWYILEILVQFRKLYWKINCEFQIIRKWITDIVRRFRKTFRIPAILPANHHKWRHNHHLRWPNSFSKPLFIFLYTYFYLLYFVVFKLFVFSIYYYYFICIIFVDFTFLFCFVDFYFCWLSYICLIFGWLVFVWLYIFGRSWKFMSTIASPEASFSPAAMLLQSSILLQLRLAAHQANPSSPLASIILAMLIHPPRFSLGS
jgi:hypothetical protein